MPQHRSKIVGVLPQPPDRREGPGSLARTLGASKLVLDLSLLPLEFLHDLLDQDRLDPGGDAAQLRVLIRLDVGQPRLEPCPSPEGLLATVPIQFLPMPGEQDLPPRDSDSYRDHVCGGGGNSEFGANPSGTGALDVAGPAAMLRPLRRALWCSGSET
jgi:hypothetical protein